MGDVSDLEFFRVLWEWFIVNMNNWLILNKKLFFISIENLEICINYVDYGIINSINFGGKLIFFSDYKIKNFFL